MKFQDVMKNRKLLPTLKKIVNHNDFYHFHDIKNYGWDSVSSILMTKGKRLGKESYKMRFVYKNGDQIDYYSGLEYREDWDTMGTGGSTEAGDFKATTQEHLLYLQTMSFLY